LFVYYNSEIAKRYHAKSIAFASSVFNKEHYQAKTTLFFFRLDTNLCFITL
ncbi:hypothetical protein T4D_16238, partial [Trichinella pseudospiralis]